MFTGIITDIGIVAAIKKTPANVRLTVTTHYNTRKIGLGASIAVSGACLTVVAKTKNSFSVDVSQETLSRTTLGALKQGNRVNLEQSLTLGDELGGHFVLGHVDAVATVIEKKSSLSSRPMTGSGIKPDPGMRRGDNSASCIFGFSAPKKLMRFIAEKGSVTLDGVSLTINRIAGNRFWVNIIPHTLSATTFADYSKGGAVNLEIDMLARYLDRLKK